MFLINNNFLFILELKLKIEKRLGGMLLVFLIIEQGLICKQDNVKGHRHFQLSVMCKRRSHLE